MKKCRDCQVIKEFDQFYKKSVNLDGLYSYCKSCTKKQFNKTREKNLEKYKEKSREYQKKNKKKILDQAKEYYQENREKILETVAVYKRKNKKEISIKEAKKRLSDTERFEKNRKKHLEWSKDNRKVLNEYQRKWYQKNKEKRKAHVCLYRAVQSEKVIRPNECSKCNKKCIPDGHHEDYTKPFEVEWLCRACHSRKSPRTVLK